MRDIRSGTAGKRSRTPEPKHRQLARAAARVSQSRGHGGTAQVLTPSRPQAPQRSYPGTTRRGFARDYRDVLGSLDTIGEYTIGLGMEKPSRMASNIIHPLRGRGPSEPQSVLADPALGIVPFGGRGPGRFGRRAKPDPAMDAATMHHNMTGEPVEKLAAQYGVDAKALHKHLRRAGKDVTPTNENLHPDAPSKRAARDINEGVGNTLGEGGGHTWMRDMRTDKGTKGYAVSIPGHEREIPAATFDQNDVVQYWKEKKDLLRADKHLRVESWRDGDSVFLDLTKIHPQRAGALRAGAEAGQKAIYDRASGEAIEVPLPRGMTPEVRASANKVMAGLSFGGAKRTLAAQEELRSIERGRRAGAAEQAMQTPGLEGMAAGRNELRGELPRVEFDALRNTFGQQETDDLFTYISQHEDLRPFEKVRAHEALFKALHGHVPTESQRRILNRVFGRDFTAAAVKHAHAPQSFKDVILNIANIPRSLMASYDVSAPFRQGLVAGARHPVMFFKNFKHMFKVLGSDKAFQALQAEIEARTTFELMDRAKLSLTELGSDLTKREEQFMSNYAEKIPVAGAGVRASSRAYVGFLNKTRADMFDFLIEKAKDAGRDPENDDHLLKSIATLVNSSTGRGDLGHFQGAATYLNTVFFSPRLLASRLNFINPLYYMRLDPFARREAVRSAANMVGITSAFLTMAAWAGAKVEQDPRNADWAKIRIGDTRIDILGGFQQPIRLIAQVASGKVISSTTGDTLSLGPGFGKLTRRDIIQRFFEGKLAPTPSMVNDFLKGTDFQGQPFSAKRELITHMVPLMLQDSFDLYKNRKSLPLAVGGYAVGAFGVGMQTYTKRDTTKAHFEQHKKDLLDDSKHFGMGEPPPKVIEDLQWKTRWDHIIQDHKGEGYRDKLPDLAKLWDERYGGHDGADMLKTIKTNRQARYHYEKMRHFMWPEYRSWESLLNHKRDQAIEQGG